MASKYPWYPTIHDIQVSMVSKYPDIRKKWYPLILSQLSEWNIKEFWGFKAILFVVIELRKCTSK